MHLVALRSLQASQALVAVVEFVALAYRLVRVATDSVDDPIRLAFVGVEIDHILGLGNPDQEVETILVEAHRMAYQGILDLAGNLEGQIVGWVVEVHKD